MKAEGIVIDDAEASWFFKQKLSLSELQRQLLQTTLGTNTDVNGKLFDSSSVCTWVRQQALLVNLLGNR